MQNMCVNDKSLNILREYTVLQILFLLYIDIPRFCYHEQLSIAGNCRMCLIEDIKSLKPIVACAINVIEGMNLYTRSIKVLKAREAVLEFLLINHPLDCPICDQGGECDLQDITLVFGSDRSRFNEYKRAVTNKNCGLFIKTVMNRCIHCTRCVRFAFEIAGLKALGVVGRGSLMEIGFYVETMLEAGLVGNMIDLCPVGALTSKPYAFVSRSWELKTFYSYDIFDCFLLGIRIDIRGNELLRVLPKYSEYGAETFIGDVTRFFYDGLKILRLQFSVIKLGDYSYKFTLQRIYGIVKLWIIAVLKLLIINKIRYIELKGELGVFSDLETVIFMKHVLNQLGVNIICNTKNFDFNKGFVDITQHVLLINSNLRLQSPGLNIKLRKSFLKGINFYYIGAFSLFNHYVYHVGVNLQKVLLFFKGKAWLSLLDLNVILDVTSLMYAYNFSLSKYIKTTVCTSYIGMNSLNNSLYDIMVSCVSKEDVRYVGVLNIGCDLSNVININSNKMLCLYMGHHEDYGALVANIVIPIPTVFETALYYIDILGQIKYCSKIINPHMIVSNIITFFKTIICRLNWRKLIMKSEVRSRLFLSAALGNILLANKVFDCHNIWVGYDNVIIRNSLNINLNMNVTKSTFKNWL